MVLHKYPPDLSDSYHKMGSPTFSMQSDTFEFFMILVFRLGNSFSSLTLARSHKYLASFVSTHSRFSERPPHLSDGVSCSTGKPIRQNKQALYCNNGDDPVFLHDPTQNQGGPSLIGRESAMQQPSSSPRLNDSPSRPSPPPVASSFFAVA